ncbi:MAG: hypothetical protein JO129_02700 [Candidatus Dependentiae bacterium]|nr:hypothetical protein [Candidatus Dependentiae bacterium]
MKRLLILLIIASFSSIPVSGRSIHREPNPTIPYVTVTASNKDYAQMWLKSNKLPKINQLRSPFWRIKTLKKPFENSNFEKHMLPSGDLKYRRGDNSINTDILKEKNEFVLQEILNGKKNFTDFTVLKDSDFNYSNLSGLIILKYKNFPFVLKLFIEHPHTFVDPFNKGFFASGLFILNGNLRHLSGFTRIHNLEYARKLLSRDPEYRYYLDFPRKWYWLPQAEPYLTIDWYDPYYNYHETIKLPGIYGIVCDFIETDKKIQQQEIHTLRQISIDVGTYLHNIIDSYVDNFVPEKNSNKIVIIDTEHFPTMVGLDKSMNANGYVQWWIELAGKYIKTAFLRSKQKRIYDQRSI